jgi:mRNA interferase MazF
VSDAIRRGDLVWFHDATTGGAIPGIPHPHVVVSDDVFNRSRIPTVNVCALTSNRRRATEPGNVLLDPGEGGLERHSVVVVSQLAAAPKATLAERIGGLSEARVEQILAGLRFQQASYDR